MKMVLSNDGDFKWIGDEVSCNIDSLKSYKHRFYNAFIQNKDCFYINDRAIIKTSSGKNKVVKLLAFYESDTISDEKARFRGVVKWYTFMSDLHKVLTIDTKYDDKNEVVEDFRYKDVSISLEDIVRKCSLVIATPKDPIYLIDSMKLDKDIYFSCRYLVNSNKLLPLIDDLSLTELTKLDEIDSTPNTKNLKRKPNDENEFPTPKAASPVKYVKLSPKKSNVAVLTPNRAKRNLNESFDISQTDISQLESSQFDTPTLNYSIVDDSPEPLKLKLRLSGKQHFNPKVVLKKLDDQLLESVLSKPDNLRRSGRVNNRKSYTDYISPLKTRNGRHQSSDSDLGLVEFTVKTPSNNRILETITDIPQNAENNLADEPKVQVLIQKTPSRRGRALSVTFGNDVITPPKKYNLEIVEEAKGSPGRSRKSKIQTSPSEPIRIQESPRPPKELQEAKVATPRAKLRPRKTESATTKVEGSGKPKRASIKPIRYQEFSDTEEALRKILSPLKLSYTPQKEEVKSLGGPRNSEIQGEKQNLTRTRHRDLFETEKCIQKILSPLKLNFSPRKTRKMSTDSEVSAATPEKRPKTPKKVQINASATPRKAYKTRKMSTDSEVNIVTPEKRPKTPKKVKINGSATPRKVYNTRKMSTDSEINIATPEKQPKTPKKVQIDEFATPRKVDKTRKMSTDSEVNIATPEKRLKTPKKVQNDEFVTPRKVYKTRKMSTDSEVEVVTPEKMSKTLKKVQIDEYSTPKKAHKEDKAPKTPKNTPSARMKLIREGVITPSMQNRKNAIPTASTPLNMARAKLHVSYMPNVLSCREKEFSDISGFVQGKLLDGCGGCMYISGVPGTGKTATVTEVIKNLQEMSAGKDLPNFTYININGMRLTEPRQSYVEIYKQLTGKTVAWEQAQTLLENKFTKSSGSKKIPIVLLVDELDILCTKRQDVVYNLLDWPTKAVNQLIVITIANTMDLPERLLMGRVTSRLGLTRLTFQAYTHKQLQEIIMKRVMGTNAFNPDAVQLVARKVASVSGDARRALDICRRAVEIAEAQGGDTLVSMTHVNEALNSMITQPKVRAIKRCSRLEQLILQSVVAEVERTGVDETTFSDVYTMLMSIAVIEGFKMVATSLVLAAVSRLGACRLLLTDQKSNDLHQRLILNVTSDDIYYALRQD